MNDRNKKWWFIGLSLGLFLGLLIWWLRRWQEQLAEHRRVRPMTLDYVPDISPPTAPDDLKRIEGIGPKIAEVLQQAGLVTFEALASTRVEHLQVILDESGIRLAWPETWPEQAQLAAAGDWAALEALQDELQGGRRV
jgi:hypothetical protein